MFRCSTKAFEQGKDCLLSNYYIAEIIIKNKSLEKLRLKNTTWMAPEEMTGSQSRFELRKRLLRAPAALAFVFDSSDASRSFVSWGIDLRKISYSLSLWYAAFPTYNIDTTIESIQQDLMVLYILNNSICIGMLPINKMPLLHGMNTMLLAFTTIMLVRMIIPFKLSLLIMKKHMPVKLLKEKFSLDSMRGAEFSQQSMQTCECVCQDQRIYLSWDQQFHSLPGTRNKYHV